MLDILSKFPVIDNNDGTYTVKRLPPGDYCFQLEKEGYFSSNPITVSVIDQNKLIEISLQKYAEAVLQFDQFYFFDLTGMNANNPGKSVHSPFTGINIFTSDDEFSINYSFTLITADNQSHTISSNVTDNTSEFMLQPGDNEESFYIIISFSEFENNNDDPIEMAITIEDWIITGIEVNPGNLSSNLQLTSLEMKLMFVPS